MTREQRPQYTAAALEQGIEGSVLLECVVRADGTVGDVKVSRSLDPVYGLDTAAMNAARQWTFEPATRDGKPVPALITVEMRFTIGNHAAAASLALPGGFSGPGQADLLSSTDRWREQTFDQGATRTHVVYPNGWITTTGLPADMILLQNPKEPFGVLLLPPTSSSATFDHAVSEPDLQKLARAVGTASGHSVTAVGQIQLGGHLWFWLDFGELSVAKGDRSAANSWSYAASFVDAAHAWLFTTITGGRQYPVLCFVTRLQNTSEAELQRLTSSAGPLFAKVLERLSFEAR